MDHLADQTEHIVLVEPRKSFLDLPGEVRNKVYALSDTIELASSCRQIRLEYLPLFFERNLVSIPFFAVLSFLQINFPIDTPDIMAKYRCKLRVNIAAGDQQADSVIDMQWLLTFLIDCPNVEVTFDGNGAFPWEARGLRKLLNIARSTPGWRERIAGFETIKLPTNTRWRPGHIDTMTGRYIQRSGYLDTMSGRYTQRPSLILKFVFKPEDVAAWWDDPDQRRLQVRKTLQELGLREEIAPYGGTNPIRGLRIGVYRKVKYAEDETSNMVGYW